MQDILRLLTLWFNHGSAPDVEAALQEGFGRVSIDTWLVVIPQVRLNKPYAIKPEPQILYMDVTGRLGCQAGLVCQSCLKKHLSVKTFQSFFSSANRKPHLHNSTAVISSSASGH